MIKSGINVIKFAKNFVSMRRMTDEQYKAKSASFILDIARSEGGMLFKFIQYLDTDARFDSFEHLASKNDFALPIQEVKDEFEKAFQIKLDDEFSIIDETPYLASLSQVHVIKDKNGKKKILKLQYPEIENKVKDQLRLFNLIPKKGMGPMKKWGVDVGMYQEMFQKILTQELDYVTEAKQMIELKKIIPQGSSLEVANVDKRFIARNIFVQDHLVGSHFEELKSWELKDKETILYLFVRSYMDLIIQTGYFQGDTNFGNYLFDKNEMKIGMIDLGQLQFLSFQKREVLFSFLEKLVHRKDVDYLSYYVALGFDKQKIMHLVNYLPMLTQIIFDPFLSDRTYELDKWNYKAKLETLLGDKKWWFRSAGDEDFFLLMKSFTGIKAFVQKAQVGLNWHRMIKDLLDNQYEYVPPKIDLPSEFSREYIASSINCLVLRGGKESVNLSFPIRAIFSLDDLMGSDILSKLERDNIIFDQLVKKALEDGGKPKLLFSLIDGDKEVRVELK